MSESKEINIMYTLSKTLSVVVLVTGLAVLLGWVFDLDVLKFVFPGLVTMKANTAVAFLLAGLAMLLRGYKSPGHGFKRLAPGLALIVALIGFLTLTQYIFHWKLGIDQLLFDENSNAIGTSNAGRMAPFTATNFLLVGIGIGSLYIETKWSKHIQVLCATLISISGYSTLMGYVYGAEAVYGILNFTQMALHTAVLFVALGWSLLFARPPYFLHMLLEKTPTGIVLRRLLPAALLILPIFGWLRYQGELRGLYDTATGTAYFTLFSAGLFIMLVWDSVRHIDRIHRLWLESEAALRQTDERLRQIWETVPVAICVTRLSDGAFLDVNQRFMLVMGLSDSDPVGSVATDFYDDPTDRASVLSVLAESGAIHDYELRIRKQDRSLAWVMLSMQHITYVGEEAILTGFQDITERKQTQERLRDSEEQFRTLVQNANDLISIIDTEGYITYDSPSVEKILGYAPDERLGHHALEYVHPEETPELTGILADVMGGPGKVVMAELRTRHKDGTWRILEAHGTNLSHNPVVGGLVAISRDVTDRKRWEQELQDLNEQLNQHTQELERSNQELQQFAYVASHDLQEPLRMVTSYLQLLVKRYGDRLDGDALEFIGFAVDGTNRMKFLINDLLAYSRVGTQGKPFAPTDCHAVVGQAINNLSETIRETKALVMIDNDLPTISADEGQLVKLFQNLIGNAIKFRRPDEPAHVVIAVQEEEDAWVFSVADNGIGIDPQYADRIFIIFQRLHTREEYVGTGIGLAICRKIVERHGGCIWVESQLDAGATFYFKLPVSEEKI